MAGRTVLDHLLEDGVITECVQVPNADTIEVSLIASHKHPEAAMRYVRTADHRLHEAVDKLPAIGTLG